MAKNKTNYFSHDSNARNDIKALSLRIKHGAAGYGVFFMILERLRNEDGYKSVKDYNTLAFDFRVDAALVKSVVEDFGLFVFTEDGKYFYSESFCKRMCQMDDIKAKRSKAAAERWRREEAGADSKEEKPRKETASAVRSETERGGISTSAGNARCLSRFFSKSSRANLETVMAQFGMKPEDTDELRKLADAVVAEWNLSETTHQDYKDWASHLINTMRIKLQSKKSAALNAPATEQQPQSYEYTGGFGSQDT